MHLPLQFGSQLEGLHQAWKSQSKDFMDLRTLGSRACSCGPEALGYKFVDV